MCTAELANCDYFMSKFTLNFRSCWKETQMLRWKMRYFGIHDSFIPKIDRISRNGTAKLNLNHAVTFPLQRNWQLTNCRITTLWTCQLCSKFHPLCYTALLKILPIMFWLMLNICLLYYAQIELDIFLLLPCKFALHG